MPSRMPICDRPTYELESQEHGTHTQDKGQQRYAITGDQDNVKHGTATPTAPQSRGQSSSEDSYMNHTPKDSDPAQATRPMNDIQAMRRVITSLPRPQTFHRQQSERRDRLLPIPPADTKRRTESTEAKHTRSCSGHNTARQQPPQPFASAPDIITPSHMHMPHAVEPGGGGSGPDKLPQVLAEKEDQTKRNLNGVAEDVLPDTDSTIDGAASTAADDAAAIQQQFQDHWILNLSMHFRDKSNREKFFVTYAQNPNLWRRMTVSLDYRNAPPDSLEAELDELHFQRDKSFRIFDALRESLPEIQFYDTVTNLKLQTTPEDGQLHVHVREDANEIIDYPSALLLSHIDCERFTEEQVSFHSHISGFVYKVVVDGKMMIKKEIPGPDTVEEFLYEVNALDSLQEYENVIHLEGLITSNDGSEIKGLLIPYCAKGALVDVIYDWEPDRLPLELRTKWARQIIQGLSNIHEAGFVQGDFTLSNIVIDENDDAYIIDINRRGCPVGWEPPELARLIEQGQRISMYIGVKTDLFQLGMVLWGLANLNDEPERCTRPLPVLEELPAFYREIVSKCLKDYPQARPSAAALLRRMDRGMDAMPLPLSSPPQLQSRTWSNHTASTHRSDKVYIDPEAAVTIDDVKRHGSATGYRYDGSSHNDGSEFPMLERSRGRSRGLSSRRRSSFYDGATTNATSISASPVLQEPGHCDLEDISSYPQEVRADDLHDKKYDPQSYLTRVPASYHRIQHEDSGFDEHMLDGLSLKSEPVLEGEGGGHPSKQPE